MPALAAADRRRSLCAVAGWLQPPFWPRVVYMALGKFGRYFVMTAGRVGFFPGQWHAPARP